MITTSATTQIWKKNKIIKIIKKSLVQTSKNKKNTQKKKKGKKNIIFLQFIPDMFEEQVYTKKKKKKIKGTESWLQASLVVLLLRGLLTSALLCFALLVAVLLAVEGENGMKGRRKKESSK